MEAAIAIEAQEKEYKNVLTNPVTLILIAITVFLTARTIYNVKRKGKTVGQSLREDIASPTFIVGLVGFVTGLSEFIIVSNINEFGVGESLKTGKIFKLPPKKEFIQTAVTLLIVSAITGLLTEQALKMLPEESRPKGIH